MLDYIRIACAVPAVQVGNTQANAEEICRLIEKADKENCDVILFPELALTGYTCGDLFFQKHLLTGVRTGIQEILAASCQFPEITIAVGAPLEILDKLYNCALVIGGGQVCGIVPKTYLPNDRCFQERRWFHGAGELMLRTIGCAELGLPGDRDIPVGNDLIFRLGDGALAAVEICEDLFAPISPSAVLTSRGAEVVLNLSASPAFPGKWEQCRRLVQNQSDTCDCIYGYVSAGCTESTQDLVFTGQCLLAESGIVLGENKCTATGADFLVWDADLGIVRARRHRNSGARSNADCCVTLPQARIVSCICGRLRADGSLYPLSRMPFAGKGSYPQIFHIQASALARRLEKLGAKAVVGVSGGLDSTLALLVAVEACRMLKRPVTDVVGITMPCFGTTGRTYHNAVALMDCLGVTRKEIRIQQAVEQHFADIGHDSGEHNTTYENAQARERTQVLMDYAGKIGGIVVGTGDMSELALGWCTYNGDHMSMYGVNAGLPKTMIAPLLQEIMQQKPYDCAAEILADIIDTPISPELLPPDSQGNIVQQTQAVVGPYVLHDFFLYYMLALGFSPKKIYTLACRAFAGEYSGETVKKWLKVFYRRFFTQQFKRSCMPEGVQVLEVSLSPRGGWQMPADAAEDLWLREVESI